MTEDLEQALQQAMAQAYGTPRDAPELAGRVVALDGKRRRRQRVGAAVTISLLVALMICIPLLVRGGANRSSPTGPGPATTGLGPTSAPTSAVNSASFAELKGWWRFTRLQAPGGTVPILRGIPAYFHFDSPTAAAAELGHNTTSLIVALQAGRLDLTRTETTTVSAAPGEIALEQYLDHLAGASSAQVSGEDLTIYGWDGAVAHLVRIPEPANPAAWSCCEPTAEPPLAVAPTDLPSCSVAELAGSFHAGYRSQYDDYNEVLLTTTGAGPCLLSGPVTIGYSSASGPVTPLHQDRQEAPLETTALSPTRLTPAQDANQAWTSALPVPVYSASSAEVGPQTPCSAAERLVITSLHITFNVGTVTVPLAGGLTTCQNQVSIGFVRPR